MKDQIEKIKEEYAKERYLGFPQQAWENEEATTLMQRAFNAALELAAEKAEVIKVNYTKDGFDYIGWRVDKESILSLKLKD